MSEEQTKNENVSKNNVVALGQWSSDPLVVEQFIQHRVAIKARLKSEAIKLLFKVI